MKIFGERVKELREEKGISQNILAKQMKSSSANVSRWESGEIVPSSETIIMLCKFFNVSADFLLGLSDNP